MVMRIYASIFISDSFIVGIIKLIRLSYIAKHFVIAKKEGLKLANLLWDWPEKEQVLIQVNCFILKLLD